MRPVFAGFSVFLIFSFASGCQSREAETVRPMVVKVVMKKYSIDPNPIRLKQGQPTTLEVSTADVQHGFNVQALNIDEPIQPGKPATIKVIPHDKGQFNVECDIVCGPRHEDMQGKIIVE